MKKKLILTSFPEYYLIALVLLSGYTPPYSLNPISIGLTLIIILQIVIKNRILGLIISGLFALANLIMFFALISDVNKYQTFIEDDNQLIVMGLLLLVINLAVSGLMIFKYIKYGLKLGSRVEVRA